MWRCEICFTFPSWNIWTGAETFAWSECLRKPVSLEILPTPLKSTLNYPLANVAESTLVSLRYTGLKSLPVTPWSLETARMVFWKMKVLTIREFDRQKGVVFLLALSFFFFIWPRVLVNTRPSRGLPPPKNHSPSRLHRLSLSSLRTLFKQPGKHVCLHSLPCFSSWSSLPDLMRQIDISALIVSLSHKVLRLLNGHICF